MAQPQDESCAAGSSVGEPQALAQEQEQEQDQVGTRLLLDSTAAKCARLGELMHALSQSEANMAIITEYFKKLAETMPTQDKDSDGVTKDKEKELTEGCDKMPKECREAIEIYGNVLWIISESIFRLCVLWPQHDVNRRELAIVMDRIRCLVVISRLESIQRNLSEAVRDIPLVVDALLRMSNLREDSIVGNIMMSSFMFCRLAPFSVLCIALLGASPDECRALFGGAGIGRFVHAALSVLNDVPDSVIGSVCAPSSSTTTSSSSEQGTEKEKATDGDEMHDETRVLLLGVVTAVKRVILSFINGAGQDERSDEILKQRETKIVALLKHRVVQAFSRAADAGEMAALVRTFPSMDDKMAPGRRECNECTWNTCQNCGIDEDVDGGVVLVPCSACQHPRFLHCSLECEHACIKFHQKLCGRTVSYQDPPGSSYVLIIDPTSPSCAAQTVTARIPISVVDGVSAEIFRYKDVLSIRSLVDTASQPASSEGAGAEVQLNVAATALVEFLATLRDGVPPRELVWSSVIIVEPSGLPLTARVADAVEQLVASLAPSWITQAAAVSASASALASDSTPRSARTAIETFEKLPVHIRSVLSADAK